MGKKEPKKTAPTKATKGFKEKRRVRKLNKTTGGKAAGYQRSSDKASLSVGFTKAAKIKGTKTKKDAKKPQEKRNWKLAFIEFPSKITKDIIRIKWVSKGILGKAFIAVLCFLIFFAIIYFAADQLYLLIFKSVNAI